APHALVGQHDRGGALPDAHRAAHADLHLDRAVPDRAGAELPRRRRPPALRRPGVDAVSPTELEQAATPSGVPGSGPLLRVEDVRTGFSTPRGTLNAVNGVSFELERGKTLGIVGESGSGKSVLSRSIMGLLPSNAHRTGR